MKLGIMQPYFFPYIGYFQLINAVNTFVVYDDVNYIKNGWINRNNILINGQARKITLSISDESSYKKINEVKVYTDKKNRRKIVDSIFYAYKKAPQFFKVMPIIDKIITNPESNLSRYLAGGLKDITSYFNIETNLVISSDLKKNNTLKSVEKVIHVCHLLNANTYINAIGGTKLYDKKVFKDAEISLNFIKTDEIEYKQFNEPFVPNLSIIELFIFYFIR